MLRNVVVISQSPAVSRFEGFPGYISRVLCFEDQQEGRTRRPEVEGVALVFSRSALARNTCLPGADLVDANVRARSGSPVRPEYLGSANYLEYRPAGV